jgi:murein DD-endopeptidase MepM/ murein hydrolase activator NlpD
MALRDFSPKLGTQRKRRPLVRLRYLIVLLLCIAMFYISRSPFWYAPDTNSVPGPGSVSIPEKSESEGEAVEAPVRVETRRVRRGDTLYGIFSDFGLPESQILELSRCRIDGIDPSRLVAGRSYRLFLQENRVVEYHYEPDQERIVCVKFSDDGPTLTVEPIPYEVENFTLRGRIEDSLFAAVDSIGERPSLAMDLADIFAWQVDFFRDLRKGDSFVVLVEKYYRENEFVRYGKILAAKFVNDGHEHQAYLFRTENGQLDYFDETGGSLRKQFLKVPLRFRRISSGFSKGRLHPVTGRVTPHLGVDYAAPTGTPVMAIGDGKVVLRKSDSINGRMIKIRHNSVYSSAYLHLNGFAKNIKVGSLVRQGQIIGYVGRSGRATGPHLHFAMYRNGQYVDPRRISVPRASSVTESDRDAFRARVEDLSPFLQPDSGNRADARPRL